MKICPKCGKEYADTNTLCPTDGAVLEKSSDWLIGQTLASKYRIEELISEGGMGTVYRGTHILMDKTVAIKVLHPALAADDKIVTRFNREARAASRISHPHALNVTDFGEAENGVVFLVMEYLAGKTLKEVIRREGPMPLPRVVEIMRQVSGALEAAHAEGVVHRDLKSDNIMLMDAGGADWAKVLDFGIAKIQEPVGQDPALTSPNLIIGTPQYMSPEQCSQASQIDARSDIYSLGVILYEMLVGHVPFTGDSPTAIMMKHLQEPPPAVLEERKDLPAAVGRVVARAMAKRPADRYQTVSELAESLTLAAESATPVIGVAGTAGPGSPDRMTNRIVVPTEPNEPPRSTASTVYDETTVVRPRQGAAAAYETARIRPDAAPPVESFNPWRIAVPAMLGLLVVFGVIYALTRNSNQPATGEQAPPLVSDPQARPVNPAQPATGQGEAGISPSAPVPAPSAQASVTTAPVTNQNRNAAASPSAEEPTDNHNDNMQRGEDQNDQEEAEPSPANPNQNNNQKREQPAPRTSPTEDESPDDDDEPPPPSPTPSRQSNKPQLPKPALPKPTLPPPAKTESPQQETAPLH